METVGKYIHICSGIPKAQRSKIGVLLIRNKLKQKITGWEAVNKNIMRVNLNIMQQKQYQIMHLSMKKISSLTNSTTKLTMWRGADKY